MDVLNDIIHATTSALVKLEKYYQVQSDFAITTLVLDPRFNTSYYAENNEEGSEIDNQVNSAKLEVLHYYNLYYKPDEREPQPIAQPLASLEVENNDFISTLFKKKRKVIPVGTCEVKLRI